MALSTVRYSDRSAFGAGAGPAASRQQAARRPPRPSRGRDGMRVMGISVVGRGCLPWGQVSNLPGHRASWKLAPTAEGLLVLVADVEGDAAVGQAADVG